MVQLDNCAQCGEVFAKSVRDICLKCYEQEEADFQTVYKFLMKRKNREATMPEIVKQTGVKEETIIKFIKQQRLRATDFPNLTYPCEKCGTPVSEGRLCENCAQNIRKQVEFHDLMEERAADRKRRQAGETFLTRTSESFNGKDLKK